MGAKKIFFSLSMLSLVAFILISLLIIPVQYGVEHGQYLATAPTTTNKDLVKSVEFVECLFPNATETEEQNTRLKYGFGGTDLGLPVYDSTRNRTLIFFGDTFKYIDQDSADNSFPDTDHDNKHWLSNVMAVSTDTNLGNGLTFDSFYTSDSSAPITNLLNGSLPSGKKVKAVFEGKHNNIEITKIPTGGVEINGTIYVFYFSKKTWDFRADSMNYGGCVKSTDGGSTWTRVNALSWANHASGTNSAFSDLVNSGNSASTIQTLLNQDINNNSINAGINIAEHEGYFFTQIYPVKHGQYVYLLGEGGYRTTGVKLARVRQANFENFASYEYFTGIDSNNNPIWVQGTAGLSLLNNKNDTGYIFGSDSLTDRNSGCGELSCMYNEYLGKWMVVYLRSTEAKPEGEYGGIMYRLADNIWGPYTDASDSFRIFKYGDAQKLPKDKNGNYAYSIYGGFISPQWVEEGGQVIYALVSQYESDGPILYTSNLVKITFNPNSYTISYKPNGGTGTMASTNCTWGISTALSNNKFTRDNYTFAGWNLLSDGSGTSFNNRASVKNLTSNENGEISLYAMWTKVNDPATSEDPDVDPTSSGGEAGDSSGEDAGSGSSSDSGSGSSGGSGDSSDTEDKVNETLDKIGDTVSSWWDKTKEWFSARWEDVKTWYKGLPEWVTYVAIGVGALIVLWIIWSIFKPKKFKSSSKNNNS